MFIIKSTRDPNDGKYYTATVILIPSKNKYLIIDFLIDTGASTTSISPDDADEYGIDYKSLPKDKQTSSGIGGRVNKYILPDCKILFISNGVKYEYKPQKLTVLDSKTIDGNECPKHSSILGIDILNQFELVIKNKQALLKI